MKPGRRAAAPRLQTLAAWLAGSLPCRLQTGHYERAFVRARSAPSPAVRLCVSVRPFASACRGRRLFGESTALTRL